MAALRGDISFRYLKQFFLVLLFVILICLFLLTFIFKLTSAKVIMVRDTPPYGHAPIYQLSLTYLERQKCYGPDKKILFKKQPSFIICYTDLFVSFDFYF
jgi:hypothetical protein